MQNKKLFYGVGIAIIILAIIGIISFLVISSPVGEIKEPPINIVGTWKLYNQAENHIPDEYMEFLEDGTFNDYRRNLEKPVLTSKYELTDKTLYIPSFERSFYIHVLSENNFALIEDNQEVQWKIVRIDGLENKIQKNDILGTWTVTNKAGQTDISEIIEFTETEFKDFRNGEKEPYIQKGYTWENDITIVPDELPSKFEIYKQSPDTIVLVELPQGYVWELKKN